MADWIDSLLTLAAQLPTGLSDPRAVEKLTREEEELHECLAQGDLLGARLEAGDVAYYAAKAMHNNLITRTYSDMRLARVAELVGLSPADVVRVAVAKYGLRARPGNPKDDTAERAAVIALGL